RALGSNHSASNKNPPSHEYRLVHTRPKTHSANNEVRLGNRDPAHNYRPPRHLQRPDKSGTERVQGSSKVRQSTSVHLHIHGRSTAVRPPLCSWLAHKRL